MYNNLIIYMISSLESLPDSLSPYKLEEIIVKKTEYVNRCKINISCIAEYDEGLARSLNKPFNEIDNTVNKMTHQWNEYRFIYFSKNTEKYKKIYENKPVNITLDPFVVSKLVDNNNMQLIKWCRQNKFKWNSNTSARAAELGNLKLLKYLIKHKCPFDKYTFQCGIRSGQLGVIDYLIVKKCDYDIYSLVEAFKLNDEIIINYVINKMNWNKYASNLEELIEVVASLL